MVLWWRISLPVQETLVPSLVGNILWRRKWQPAPIFLPGKFHGQRSLAGYSPWGHKEADTTDWVNARADKYKWDIFFTGYTIIPGVCWLCYRYEAESKNSKVENPNFIICYLQVSFSSLILTDVVLNSAGTRKKINKHIQRYRSYWT